MNRKKDILKIILVVLIAVFLMLCAGAFLLAGHRKNQQKEQEKQEALESLENVPTAAPTSTPAPSPTPTLTPAPTPTLAVTKAPAFNPENYQNLWYSTDGLASINIHSLNMEQVSFSFSQANKKGTRVCEAEVTAEVAGNAAQFIFTDSFGSTASGNLIFDREGLYAEISTIAQAEGASVSPDVSGMMTREPLQIPAEPDPTATPVPTPQATQAPEQTGDYFFPESASRYLTDEEVSRYSSSDLELAKNEIYARHGRKFVTERISEYFNGKSWYQGTIEPEEFDAMQDSIFNEYEIANIDKIAQWEAEKRESEQ